MQEKVEEGFRVLNLEKDVDKDVLEFVRKYQILASHLYWSRRLGIKPSDIITEKLQRDVKSYWRWQVIDERSPMYLFKNVERTSRPYSMLIRIPLLTAPRPKGEVSTPTGASLIIQAPLTGAASQFSARRQLGAVHGSSSVRLAMHQHTRVYIPKNI